MRRREPQTDLLGRRQLSIAVDSYRLAGLLHRNRLRGCPLDGNRWQNRLQPIDNISNHLLQAFLGSLLLQLSQLHIVVSQMIADRLNILLHTGKHRRERIDSLLPLPGTWIVDNIGLTEVQTGFDEPVIVPANSVTVWAVGGGAIIDFTTSYNGKTDILTIAFDPAIRDDRLTVVIDYSVTDLAGNELDGDGASSRFHGHRSDRGGPDPRQRQPCSIRGRH